MEICQLTTSTTTSKHIIQSSSRNAERAILLNPIFLIRLFTSSQWERYRIYTFVSDTLETHSVPTWRVYSVHDNAFCAEIQFGVFRPRDSDNEYATTAVRHISAGPVRFARAAGTHENNISTLYYNNIANIYVLYCTCTRIVTRMNIYHHCYYYYDRYIKSRPLYTVCIRVCCAYVIIKQYNTRFNTRHSLKTARIENCTVWSHTQVVLKRATGAFWWSRVSGFVRWNPTTTTTVGAKN